MNDQAKVNSIAEAFEKKVPRRAHLERNIPAEIAIRDAIFEVEKLGAHPDLTYVVQELGDALTDLANWYDDGASGAYAPQNRGANLNKALSCDCRGPSDLAEHQPWCAFLFKVMP
jgi:hypothetical protein